MTNDECLLAILRGAFETVRRGEDGPYLAENTLAALASQTGITATRLGPDRRSDKTTQAYIDLERDEPVYVEDGQGCPVEPHTHENQADHQE